MSSTGASTPQHLRCPGERTDYTRVRVRVIGVVHACIDSGIVVSVDTCFYDKMHLVPRDPGDIGGNTVGSGSGGCDRTKGRKREDGALAVRLQVP